MSPMCAAKLSVRVGFGLSLALFGLAHYLNMSGPGGFIEMTAANFDGPIAGLAKLWAYILPLLQIVGGVLLAANYQAKLGSLCAGVALASIAVGTALKVAIGSFDDMSQMMGAVSAINNTMLWRLVYLVVCKCCMCCGGDKSGGSC